MTLYTDHKQLLFSFAKYLDQEIYQLKHFFQVTSDIWFLAFNDVDALSRLEIHAIDRDFEAMMAT